MGIIYLIALFGCDVPLGLTMIALSAVAVAVMFEKGVGCTSRDVICSLQGSGHFMH